MPDDPVNRIVRYIETGYSDSLRRIDVFLSRLRIQHSHRCFVVARMGSTGSTWLAKLLNSHPDVFCSHERVVSQVFPAAGYGAADIENLIELLATDTMKHAYAAAGDVGSIWSGYAAGLSGLFTTGLLVRHPARILSRRLAKGSLAFSDIPAEACRSIHELWDIAVEPLTPLNRVFVHDLHTFATQVFCLDRIDCVMRIEDFVDGEHCRQAMTKLTGVEYNDELIGAAVACRVNVGGPHKSVPAIVEEFTPCQRDWYERVLGEVAAYFGYDLFSDETSTPSFGRQIAAASPVEANEPKPAAPGAGADVCPV